MDFFVFDVSRIDQIKYEQKYNVLPDFLAKKICGKNRDFGRNLWQKSRLWSKCVAKIETLVEICGKNRDFGRNFCKIEPLVEIFGKNRDFGRNFLPKSSLWSKFLPKSRLWSKFLLQIEILNAIKFRTKIKILATNEKKSNK